MSFHGEVRKNSSLLAALSIALYSTGAHALEPGELAGEPVLLDVTANSSVYYNFDNRDSKPNQVASAANDHWGALYNRLTTQATLGQFQFGLRLDSAWFYRSPAAAQ